MVATRGTGETPGTTATLAGGGHFRNAQVFQRAVDHSLQFVGIFDLAALGKNDARLRCIEPGGIAVVFVGTAGLADFHQKSLNDIFLHASGLPKDAFRMNVDMEVARLDDADSARFFFGFAFGGLAVREAGLRGSLGKRPLIAAVSMDQKKLDLRIHAPIADSRHLQGQRKPRDPRQAHCE